MAVTINIVVDWTIPTEGYAPRLIDRPRIAKAVEDLAPATIGSSLISVAAIATSAGVRASFNFEEIDNLDLLIDDIRDLGNGRAAFAFDDFAVVKAPSRD